MSSFPKLRYKSWYRFNSKTSIPTASPSKYSSTVTPLKNGGTALIFPADVSSAASIKDAFAEIKSQLDAPSVLVYNAGAFQMAGILELTPEQSQAINHHNCLPIGGLFSLQVAYTL